MTTNIETTRQMVIDNIREIQSIPKQGEYSAMQLHGSMMDRQQRRSDTQYYQQLREREKRMVKDLAILDAYIAASKIKVNLTYDEYGGIISTPIIPEPTVSIWSQIPLPSRQLTRRAQKPRLNRKRRIKK